MEELDWQEEESYVAPATSAYARGYQDGLAASRWLDSETENWMESEVENFLDRLVAVGTPIRGGAGIVELMRAAYRRGCVSSNMGAKP